jgi:DNA repair protein RAD50
MDELMTQLLGVSRPILENVIFCHQLDSEWPLSDDKTLKKRFDDIFAATKYTKALESIKKFRNDQQLTTKDLQRDLDVLTNNLEASQRLQADLTISGKKLIELTEIR